MLFAARADERRVGSVALGEREVEAIMPLVDGVAVRERAQALGGKGPDRFEHPQPGASADLPAHEQALGDQPVERVQARAGDRLRRLHRRAPGEHRQAREARLFARVEQLVAPVDRRAQRALARRRVARRAPSAPTAASRRSAISAGQSNPQRAAASSIASGSPSTRRQISATAAALPSSRPNPGSCARARSQNNATASAASAPGASRLRQRERRYRMRCSACTASGSRLVASTVTPGHAATSTADERRGTRQVLAVIDHQQQCLTAR